MFISEKEIWEERTKLQKASLPVVAGTQKTKRLITTSGGLTLLTSGTDRGGSQIRNLKFQISNVFPLQKKATRIHR